MIDSETLYIPIPNLTLVPDEFPEKETIDGSFACILMIKLEGALFPTFLLLTNILTINNPVHFIIIYFG